MTIFYILFISGIFGFCAITFYSFTNQLLNGLPITIIIELILFWVCVGPSITYYYVCKLKKTINDYNNLYNKYEEILRVADDLHLDNVVSKKEFVNKITKATDTEYEVIEKQKLTIKELTKQRNRYKEEYIELKKKYLQLEEKIRKDGFLS